jgi:sugar lactone lactonase YvrE
MKLKFYFLAAALFFLANSKAQIITSIAGTGTGGFSGDGGLATNAQMNSPEGVCVDASGNVYFSDGKNNRIRKINRSTGIITTIAGSGTRGYSGDGGLAINAQLDGPAGISIDNSGNIYFSETYNHCIRKITISTGIINTIGGTGTAGYSGDGGLAINAKLNDPTGLFMDVSGDLYISDTDNERIRKISASTGIISTIAGNGSYGFSGDGGLAINCQLWRPNGFFKDILGNMYIADQGNNRIRKINASTNIITTIAGNGDFYYSGDGGSATSAGIFYPQGICVDGSGNLFFVSDSSRIRKVTISTGIITTIAGTSGNGGYSGDGGLAVNAVLNWPEGIFIDITGNIYIADTYNNRIRKITIGCLVPTAPGSISGNTTVCPANTYKYSIAPVSGATSYTWTLPSGWSGTSTKDSIIVTTNSSIGDITVKANNSCGSSPVQTLSILQNGKPSAPSVIYGNQAVCPGSTNVYSISNVPKASSYIWTLPVGWSGTSTTTSINAVADSNIGNITVKANNICGSSAAAVLSITNNGTLLPIDSIYGNQAVCPLDTNVYSVTPISGASTYTWTLPSGWSGTSTTPSIIAISDTSKGVITVKANNACTSTPVQTLTIIRNGTLPSPGAISGNVSICPGSNNTYSVTPVPGATSYIWSVPSGWAGSYTGNSLTSTAGTSSGNITVKAKNKCASSSLQTLNVVVNSAVPPAQPASINGSNTVCVGSTNTYSVTAVPGAKSYTWTIPSSWSGSSTTNSISVVTGSTGDIMVKANNYCSSSPNQVLNVNVSNNSPAQPGSISGSIVVCAGTENNYSVSPVSGATSYTWTLPSGWIGNSVTDTITAIADTVDGTITVKTINGCGSSSTQSLIVTALKPVDKTVTQNGITLSANAAGANYQWIDCNNNISIAGATSQSFNPTVSGSFAVIVSKNGCFDISACFTVNMVGIKENANKSVFSVYPNPNNGNMTFEYNLQSNEGLFELTDLMGRKLLSYKLACGHNKLIVSEENLNAGIYFYQVKVGGSLVTKDKLIINR